MEQLCLRVCTVPHSLNPVRMEPNVYWALYGVGLGKRRIVAVDL